MRKRQRMLNDQRGFTMSDVIPRLQLAALEWRVVSHSLAARRSTGVQGVYSSNRHVRFRANRALSPHRRMTEFDPLRA
jgi:phospholipase C